MAKIRHIAYRAENPEAMAKFFVDAFEMTVAQRRERGAIDLTDGTLNITDSYTDRILPLDAQAARLAGQISDAAIAQGCHPGFADVAIAALAQNAGLILLTCNLKHFLPLGVACADPLIALPGTHPNSAPAADSE